MAAIIGSAWRTGGPRKPPSLKFKPDAPLVRLRRRLRSLLIGRDLLDRSIEYDGRELDILKNENAIRDCRETIRQAES